MNSGYLEGEICGINACINVCKHNQSKTCLELENIFREMLSQFSAALSEDVKKSYFKGV